MRARPSIVLPLIISLFLAVGQAEEPKLPHAQKTMPGPALSPEEGIAKMVLPPGFKIECICHEPDVINPTAYTFDERGRIWVCESIEYPRAPAGPGKDRIKILEFSEKDNQYHYLKTVKEGLNIPCGVVMGNGGFYYTNSPDVVFAQLDENDKIVKEEVILTGFGRDDRHELPNSLTWGPDGWLYGLNGVFNQSKVENQGKTYRFTCAVWRWHPKTKKFELFAEGTSNPWGLDYNAQGDWFVSCCVIKHLFHITQSGYYFRQGGPYPPFTHAIDQKLVATEEHFMAANAGLCIYQGDAFPPEYQGAFLMGNLHGSQVNRDVVTRNGSTYLQKNGPDFIDAHDKWFMPVASKVGPDGCLYVMDWYDKYHCYQDSGRADLDRERGRIYRISYKDTPRRVTPNLKTWDVRDLIGELSDPNQWQRREAQRLIHERMDEYHRDQTEVKIELMKRMLQDLALATDNKSQSHMHALWLLCSEDSMDEAFHLQLLNHTDPVRRNWGVRMIGQLGKVSKPIYEKLITLAKDPSPDVRLQVPVAAGRLIDNDPVPVLIAMLENPENAKDPIIPNILYNNFKPLACSLEKGGRGEELMRLLDEKQAAIAPFNDKTVAWLKECIAGGGDFNPVVFAEALKGSLAKANGDAAKERAALLTCIDAFNAAGVKPENRARSVENKVRVEAARLAAKEGPQRIAAALLAIWWREPRAVDFARTTAADPKADPADRAALIKALGEAKDAGSFDTLAAIFNDTHTPIAIRKNAADALGATDGAKAAGVLLAEFKALAPELKSAAVNNLAGNATGAKALLEALEAKKLAPADINSNNASSIAQLNDPALTARLTALWGKVKTSAERDPARVEVVTKMRTLINARTKANKPGNALNGWKVFEKNCQQCHVIYGKGTPNIGPELTGVGRENLDAVLNSVLDPNLVIGAGYFQYRVKTNDGQLFNGLKVEETEKTFSLKVAGGEIKKFELADLARKPDAAKLSLMPEELEKVMTEDEFCDLVAFMLTKEEPKK